jgi:hypothetical protein
LRLGRTEQFRPGADLLEFIGRPLLVGVNPDAVEASPRMTPPYLPPGTVRIERGLLRKAKLIADDRGVDLSDYLTTILKPAVARDWAKFAKKMIEEEEGGGE